MDELVAKTGNYNNGLVLFSNRDSDTSFKGRFNYFTANNTISLQNLTSNGTASNSQFILNHKLMADITFNNKKPFQYPLRKDMFIYVYAYQNPATPLMETDFKVSNIVNETTIELDPTYNNFGSDVIFDFNGTTIGVGAII